MGERRRHPRFKIKVPVEIRPETNSGASRVVTDEISIYGCYISTMFTLNVGTKAGLALWFNDEKIRTPAVVATRYPQLGNGFEFINLTSEERLKLSEYILRWQQESTNSDKVADN